MRNPRTTPATVATGIVPSHESRPYPAAAGSANSRPMVVILDARSSPTASGDLGSGCLTTHHPRFPVGTRGTAPIRTNRGEETYRTFQSKKFILRG